MINHKNKKEETSMELFRNTADIIHIEVLSKTATGQVTGIVPLYYNSQFPYYIYIISCQANILSTVSITKHIECVNLIIFRGDFLEGKNMCFTNSQHKFMFRIGDYDSDVSGQRSTNTCVFIFLFR